MKRYSSLFVMVAVVMIFALNAYATVVTIDLRQTQIESGSNVTTGTWIWGGGDGRAFDLEFSSGSGSHIDLDGDTAGGNEYFTGLESLTNHTHDLLKAEYLGGNLWSVSASRDGTNFTDLGSITEYTGSLSHVDNYGYETAGDDRSDPTNGPDGAGVNYSTWEPWKAWFWIYRDILADTISLNIVCGSAGPPPQDSGTISDSGSFNAEVLISGDYLGTAAELQGNEPGETEGTNPFSLHVDWNAGFDDGAVIGDITPTIPEPATIALLGLGSLTLLNKRSKK